MADLERTPSSASEDDRLPIQKSDDALAMFRHDLMTPINLIIGYSEMMEEDFSEAGGKAPADLAKIRTAARRMMELIDENLRKEKGEGPLKGGKSARAVPETPVPLVRKSRAGDADPTQKECFLVVDDNELNRDLLTRLLTRQGYASMTANNGREALDLIRQRAFDIVLLDVMMPEMDGVELLGLLKSDDKLRHIPVIMISAFTEMEKTAQCIKQGAEDYLPKPFNSTLLLARIASCLERKRLRDKEQEMYLALLESQQELAGELKEAADHVTNLLPAPIKSGDIRTDWRFVPSTHLGGDAFGYFPLDDEHFAIFLLDVCGHGVSAALLSITAMNTLRSKSLPGADLKDPSSVLFTLNNRFQMSDHNNMYFTIWYGVYNKKTRKLAYGSGGHPPAILVREDVGEGTLVKKLITGGPVIGIAPGIPYRGAMVDVPAGARLFVFSDGTYELDKPGGGMLTMDEFVDELARPRVAGKSDLERIVTFSTSVQGSALFEDDFSIVQIDF